MKLILVRHGNTFGPGDTPVYVGRNEDLPLVPRGFEQAVEVSEGLAHYDTTPAVIFCSPLQRTKAFADKIIETMSLSLGSKVHPALNEVDYGDWGGLSSDEIVQQYGHDVLEAWDKRNEWPKEGNWPGDQGAIQEGVFDFVKEVRANSAEDDAILVVSSNGVLRHFLNLIPGELERRIEAGNFKMKTGFMSQFTFNGDEIRLDYWNSDPRVDC